MTHPTTPSREFSGELACCDMCGCPDASTEYVPAAVHSYLDLGDDRRMSPDGILWPTDRFLKRRCVRCGYEWAEAVITSAETPCDRCKGSGIDPEDSDPDVNAFSPCPYCDPAHRH